MNLDRRPYWAVKEIVCQGKKQNQTLSFVSSAYLDLLSVWKGNKLPNCATIYSSIVFIDR